MSANGFAIGASVIARDAGPLSKNPCRPEAKAGRPSADCGSDAAFRRGGRNASISCVGRAEVIDGPFDACFEDEVGGTGDVRDVSVDVATSAETFNIVIGG